MLIGLVGEKGVGKDAAAEILCLNRGFQRFAFGDALKREVDWAIKGIDCEYLDDAPQAVKYLIAWARGKKAPLWRRLLGAEPWPDMQSPYNKPYFLGMRQLVQAFGTEYRRNQNPNYWVDILKDQVREGLVTGANIVISDVRFANEIEMIWSLGGKIWKIKRLKAWHEANRDAASDHRSENEWKWSHRDHTINNYGDLAMLERRVLREHDRINPYWKTA